MLLIFYFVHFYNLQSALTVQPKHIQSYIGKQKAWIKGVVLF